MQTVKVVAPAKVNLFLGIGERQADGYHSVVSVMHALAMHDRLEITLIEGGESVSLLEPGDAAQPLRQVDVEPQPGSGLNVGANMVWTSGMDPIAIPDQDNLVCKAVHRLADAVGRHEDEAVRIVVEKRVPHQTGLGGGSSDAAAALVGMASLWGIDPSDQRVGQVARSLGADVAFFLHGGCALLDGAGDSFVHGLEPSKKSVVVVKPEGGVSTAAAYAAFDENPVEIADSLLSVAQGAQRADQVPLFNNLAPASERLHGALAEVRAFANGFAGVEGVLLCGSGSGTFAVCDSYETAQSLSAAASSRGWWARVTSFTSLGAAVLPG